MAETFTCPVCGYPGLSEPARFPGGGSSYDYCLSCGFQFGFTDDAEGYTYESWRARWISRGMPWEFIDIEPAPPGWDPQRQLDDLLRNGAPS